MRGGRARRRRIRPLSATSESGGSISLASTRRPSKGPSVCISVGLDPSLGAMRTWIGNGPVVVCLLVGDCEHYASFPFPATQCTDPRSFRPNPDNK